MFILSLLIFHSSSLEFNYYPSTKVSPTPRSLSSIEYLQSSNQVIIFGGQDSSGVTSEFSVFDLSTSMWEVETFEGPIPSARHSMASTLSKDEKFFYIFGGFTDSGISSELWKLDLDLKSWELLKYSGSIPGLFAMGFAKRYEEGNFLYVIGGESESETNEDLYVFELDQLFVYQIKISELSGMIYPFLICFNESLWIVGGYYLDGDSPVFNQKLLRVDLSKYQVEEVPLNGTVKKRLHTSAVFLNQSNLLIFPGIDENKNFQESQLITLNSCKIQDIHLSLKAIYSSSTYSSSSSYIFGGQDNISFHNDFFQISSNLSTVLLSSNSISPPSRSSSSLVPMETSLFMFGGCMKNIYFNDLWSFSIPSKSWSKLSPSGVPPQGRCNFGFTSEGFRIFIFSGKGDEYFNDLFEFNGFANTWRQLDLDLEEKPSPREGACIVYNQDSIFIYGGVKDLQVFNEMWRFNLKTNEYSLIGSGTATGVKHFCSLDKEKSKIWIVSTPKTNYLKMISSFDIESLVWTDHLNQVVRGANSADFIVNNFLVTLGGTTWNSHSKKNLMVYDLESHKSQNFKVNHSFYASSISHHGSSLFIFGGVTMKGNFFFSSKATNSLLELDLKSILGKTFCSSGCYLKNDSCFPCESGKYSLAVNMKSCEACPKGTYNKISAASSQQQCIPCNSGTWNNQTGQSFCRDCPSNYYCPYGSAYPSEFEILGEDDTIQPEGFKDKSKEYSYYSTLIISLIAALFAIGLITVIFLTKVRQKLYLLDIYTNLHNHKQLVPMYIKKTNLGGCCSMIFVVSAFSFIVLTIVRYNILNTVEVRTLVPLVTITEDFQADFNFDVELYYYGGLCESEGQCVNSKITPFGIKGPLKSSCFKDNQICKVKMTCTNCELGTSNSILLEFSEEFSFCSYISVNLTSTSSIPGKTSSAKILTASDSSTYFKGINPSIFTFSLIPTLFKSLSKSNSGFHISKDTPVVKGSQYKSESFSYGSGVKVQVNLQVLNTCLHISRDDKTSQVELFSALIGTVFGILSSIGGLMNYSEKYYEYVSAWFYHKNVLKYYFRRVRRIMAMIYQDNTFANNYGAKSFPFTPKDSRSESFNEEATLYRSRTNMSLGK